MSEKKFIITEDFKNVLSKINSDIANILLQDNIDENILAKPEKNFNYVDISRTTKGHISYLTQEKIDKIEATEEKNYWEPKRRYHARPGSFIKKLLKVNDYEIEDFTTQFLSIVDPPVFEMKVVKGQDVAKYYGQNSYYDFRGTLGSSCMRNSPPNFFDIYVHNPEQINMLVMINPSNKILGRALLWNGPDFKLMDRIYVSIDGHENYFYNWAKENEYYYKEFNTYNTPTHIVFNDVKEFKKFEITIDKSEFEYYPYLDTFKWLDVKNKKFYNYIPEGEFITVSDHQGGHLNPDHFAFCEYTKEICTSEHLVFVEYLGMNINDDILSFSATLDTYIVDAHSKFCPDICDRIFNEEYDKFNDWGKINKKKEEFEEKRKNGGNDGLVSNWSSMGGWAKIPRKYLEEEPDIPNEQPSWAYTAAVAVDPEQPIENAERYTVTLTCDSWEDKTE